MLTRIWQLAREGADTIEIASLWVLVLKVEEKVSAQLQVIPVRVSQLRRESREDGQDDELDFEDKHQYQEQVLMSECCILNQSEWILFIWFEWRECFLWLYFIIINFLN